MSLFRFACILMLCRCTRQSQPPPQWVLWMLNHAGRQFSVARNLCHVRKIVYTHITGAAASCNSNIGICVALPTGKTGSALHGQLRSFGRKGPIEQNSFQTALEGSCRPLRFEVS